MYDLKLDENDVDQGISEDEDVNALQMESGTSVDSPGNETQGVKAFSGKTQDDIEKMLSDFKKEQKKCDPNAPEVIELEN